MKINKSFSRGLIQAFDITGSLGRNFVCRKLEQIRDKKEKTDLENIKQDWKNVGGYMCHAMENL